MWMYLYVLKDFNFYNLNNYNASINDDLSCSYQVVTYNFNKLIKWQKTFNFIAEKAHHTYQRIQTAYGHMLKWTLQSPLKWK